MKSGTTFLNSRPFSAFALRATSGSGRRTRIAARGLIVILRKGRGRSGRRPRTGCANCCRGTFGLRAPLQSLSGSARRAAWRKRGRIRFGGGRDEYGKASSFLGQTAGRGSDGGHTALARLVQRAGARRRKSDDRLGTRLRNKTRPRPHRRTHRRTGPGPAPWAHSVNVNMIQQGGPD